MTGEDPPVSVTSLASKLIDKLPLNTLKELEELGAVRLRRRGFKNLLAVMEDVACCAADRGLDVSQAQTSRCTWDFLGLKRHLCAKTNLCGGGGRSCFCR